MKKIIHLPDLRVFFMLFTAFKSKKTEENLLSEHKILLKGFGIQVAIYITVSWRQVSDTYLDHERREQWTKKKTRAMALAAG